MDSDHYIFRKLSTCRSVHKLVSVNRPIGYSSIRHYFKRSFQDIVPDVSQFGTHCLRAGGASAASHVGVQERLSSATAGGKVSTKNTYVDDCLDSKLQVSKMLGI